MSGDNQLSQSGGSSDKERENVCPESTIIPEKYLNQLRDLGLWFTAAPHCFNHGVRIYKPIEAGGNGFNGFEVTDTVRLLEENGELVTERLNPKSDAAVLVFHQDVDETWVVYGVDCVGGMGPADFVNVWDSAEEAIADIKDFYFGDSARMKAKARVQGRA